MGGSGMFYLPLISREPEPEDPRLLVLAKALIEAREALREIRDHLPHPSECTSIHLTATNILDRKDASALASEIVKGKP